MSKTTEQERTTWNTNRCQYIFTGQGGSIQCNSRYTDMYNGVRYCHLHSKGVLSNTSPAYSRTAMNKTSCSFTIMTVTGEEKECGEIATCMYGTLPSCARHYDMHKQGFVIENEHPKVEEQEIKFTSGASSSKKPKLSYIPYRALCRLADRFELGVKQKGDAAWNALSNQKPLDDRDFIISRLEHTIHHAAMLLAMYTGQLPYDGDDHAAAIAWAGCFLTEAFPPDTDKFEPRKGYDVR